MKTMTKIIKWITLFLTVLLSVFILQSTLLAESSLKSKTLEKLAITEQSKLVNSTQSDQFNKSEQTLLIAQNSGQTSKSNSQNWKVILGYIVGGVVVVIFILSRIQM
jgi:hypothetical protein